MPPHAKTIIEIVATAYGLKMSDILSQRRSAAIVRARHVAMYLVREHLRVSTPSIGQYFGRDHTTVIHACAKVEDLIAEGEVNVSILDIRIRNLLNRRSTRQQEQEDFRRLSYRLSRHLARRVNDALQSDPARFMRKLNGVLEDMNV